MQNLRDKLLKAGLVSAADLEKAEEAKARRPAPPKREEPRLPPLPPLPGSKAAQRLDAIKQRESDERLRTLARGAEVAREEGPHVFHFMTRKGKLRRIDLSESQAKLLETGALAVVECPEPAEIQHVLVPAATALKMLALSAKAVRFLNRPDAPIGFDDDPQADV